MSSNNIINEILLKMSQIDFYFENNQQDTVNNNKQHQQQQDSSNLIDTHFLTKTFIKPELPSQPPIAPKRAPGPDRRKLFVGNLAAKTTLQELLDAFGRFGPINESLCVVKDDNYAFIHYYNETDAERAFKAMNDSYFKNRYIRVQYSTSQGHMKKSKTFVSNRLTTSASCCSFTMSKCLPTSASQYSSFASINETIEPTNNNINMLSSYSFSNQNLSATSNQQLQQQQQRPIIGRSISKASGINSQDYSTPFLLQDHYQSMPYLTNTSLLMPANSEENRRNQIKMLQQQQQQFLQQFSLSSTNNSSYDMFFGSNRLNDFASSFCSAPKQDKENSSYEQLYFNSNAKPSVFFDSTETYLNKL